MEWTSVLLSALFAGIVATAVTVAIEKWGGLVGGLLGTVPSTIVPAGIGMYVAGGEEVLVLEGLIRDADGEYPAGTWLRFPDGSEHDVRSSGEGALLYVKEGHL